MRIYILVFKRSFTFLFLDPKFQFSFAVSVVDLNRAHLSQESFKTLFGLDVGATVLPCTAMCKTLKMCQDAHVGSLREKCSFSACGVQQAQAGVGH